MQIDTLNTILPEKTKFDYQSNTFHDFFVSSLKLYDFVNFLNSLMEFLDFHEFRDS